MAAKAMVPVEAFPCINRFRGHGPLLQEPPLRSAPGRCTTNCRSGPWPHGTTLSLRCTIVQDLSARDVARDLEQWMPLRPSLDRLGLHAVWTNG